MSDSRIGLGRVKKEKEANTMKKRVLVLVGMAFCMVLISAPKILFAQEDASDFRGVRRDRREDIRDRKEDKRDRREDKRDRREDVKDRKEDKKDRKEDIRDRKEDKKDRREIFATDEKISGTVKMTK